MPLLVPRRHHVKIVVAWLPRRHHRRQRLVMSKWRVVNEKEFFLLPVAQTMAHHDHRLGSSKQYGGCSAIVGCVW